MRNRAPPSSKTAGSYRPTSLRNASGAWRCQGIRSVARLSGDDLCLQAVELLLRDRALLAEVVELVQLVDGGAAGHVLDVALAGLLQVGLVLDRALAHALAADDQVDQRGQERDDDEEEDPHRLPPAGDLVIPEQVDHDRDQDPDPDHEEEDLEDRKHGVAQAVIGEGDGHGPTLTARLDL